MLATAYKTKVHPTLQLQIESLPHFGKEQIKRRKTGASNIQADTDRCKQTQRLAAVSSCSNHVLPPVFPPLNERRPGLRPRPHNFTLPDKDDTYFIPRVLYRVLNH